MSSALVQSVRLYRAQPPLLYGLLLPFLLLSVAAGSTAWWWTGDGEAGLLAFVAVEVVHILVGLSSYWSVHVLCFFFCIKVLIRPPNTLNTLLP
jgi:hypothetical protein